MSTLFVLSTAVGGLVTLRRLFYILDVGGRRDVFVVHPVEVVEAHAKQLHIGGVAAEAETTASAIDRLVITGEAPGEVVESTIPWNLLALVAFTFGLGGLLGMLLSLSTPWTYAAAGGGALIGAAAGFSLRVLRRKWD